MEIILKNTISILDNYTNFLYFRENNNNWKYHFFEKYESLLVYKKILYYNSISQKTKLNYILVVFKKFLYQPKNNVSIFCHINVINLQFRVLAENNSCNSMSMFSKFLQHFLGGDVIEFVIDLSTDPEAILLFRRQNNFLIIIIIQFAIWTKAYCLNTKWMIFQCRNTVSVYNIPKFNSYIFTSTS